MLTAQCTCVSRPSFLQFKRMIMEKAALFILVCLLGYQANGQSQGDLRLNNYESTGGASGRLEIYYNFQWGTVCDDSFGSTEADVACRQLGYSSAFRYGNVGSLGFSQASSSTSIWLDNVNCFGSESRLTSCRHNGYGVHDCTHSEDVALRCSGASTPTSGSLRLNNYGSTGGSSGRLEIYYNSQWGTVCDDSFGSSDATVACRQLGYSSASNYGSVGTLGFSQGSSFSRIWLDELQCTGFESRLDSCSHNGFGNEDCSHSEDIALRCSTTGTGTFNTIGAIVGGIVGGVIFLIVIVVVCIVLFVGIAACSKSSSRRTVRAVHPPTTSNMVDYTATQGNTTYPTQQATYSAGPQQPPPSAYPAGPQQPPPGAYPTQQDPYPNKEPVNPEFSTEAPPTYNNPAYPPPVAYPPADPNAGYPPPNSGYPADYPTGE